MNVATPTTAEQSITLTAADGRALGATLYAASYDGTADASPPTLVIGSALGVKRRFYAAFARYAANHGFAVLTFDYRGVGDSRLPGSMRQDTARLTDWATLDLKAAFDFAHARSSGVYFLGHSIGGQLFAILPDTNVQAVVLVASQVGYWRRWPKLTHRIGMFALWHLFAPTVTRALGRLPLSLAGAGEDIPARVGQEWAYWGRSPRYLQRYTDTQPSDGLRTYTGPLSSYAFGDDAFAPPPSVEGLERLYARAQVNSVRLAPSDLGVRSVGHFGMFRSSFRDQLWQRWLKDLRTK